MALMRKAIALTRQHIDSVEAIRCVIVAACGLALIAAGQALPL